MISSKSPNERIADLEREVADLKQGFRTTGYFGIMLLEETLEQLVGERLLPVETARDIWTRVEGHMAAVHAGNTHLAWGASGAIPRRYGLTRSAPPRTHREKLRLRMRKPDGDQ